MTARQAFSQTSLEIAILLAAPREKRLEGGHYHFGVGLAQALERRGHRPILYYHNESIDSSSLDIVISMRGLTSHAFPAESIKIIWSISHPDLLTWEEIDAADLLFCASLTWAEMLRFAGKQNVFPLLQCTDRARFFSEAN